MKKTSKILSIILTMLMIISIVPITASAAIYSGTCGDNLTWTFDESTGILTISGIGAMEDYTYDSPWEDIDNKIKKLVVEDGVTTIGNKAFYSYYWLVDVVLADSVTTIGRLAFAYSDNITNVTFGSGLETIEYAAFCDCTSLKNVELPNSLKVIGESAFDGCEKLESVTIPYGVEIIGDSAFLFCKKLTGLVIPNSVTEIGVNAFSCCYALTELTIPDSVKTIGESAFSSCRAVASVSIGSGVETIGKNAFAYCENLTSVTIPKSVTTIEETAFACCEKLSSITVDSDSEYFANDEYGVLFNKDKTMLIQYPAGSTETKYTIPDGVTKLCEWSFLDCFNLESVTIPVSVTTIGRCAFSSYTQTIQIYYNGTSNQWNELLINNSDTADFLANNYVVHCTDETLYPTGACGDNLTWSYDTYTNTLTISGTGTMYDYKYGIGGFGTYPWVVFAYDIEHVIIKDGVTSIGVCGFVDCENLIDIQLTDSITLIDDDAFAYCDNFKYVYFAGTEGQWNSISIGENNELIKATIYYNVTEPHVHNYESVTTTPTCTEQGYTTYTCECGESYVDNYVCKLGHTDNDNNEYCEVCNEYIYTATGTCGDNLVWQFNESTDTLTISGAGAMSDYGSNNRPWEEYKDDIVTVVINEGVTTIGKYAFDNFHKLTSVTICDEVTEIGERAFYNCTYLKTVTFGNSVTTIGEKAFYRCTYLKTVTLGNSVTTIGEHAFYYCTCLETVTLGNSVTTIGKYAFCYCTCLETIIISKNLKRVGNSAFYLCDKIKDVYYTGTETEWEEISIGSSNTPLLNATIHYGYHMHKYDLVITPPTCTEQGYTTYTCACGDSYIDHYVDSLGHDMIIDEAVAPDCINTGLTEGSHCSRCDDATTEQEIIPALGHSHDEVITPPTCTEQGYTTYTCTCGDSYIDDYVDAKGHNYVDNVCTGCGDTIILNGWQLEDGKWAYYVNNEKLTNKWIKDSVDWCYIGEDGYCVTNTWKADSKGWCYVGADCRIIRNQWLKDNGKWYFIDANGYMVSNKWMKDSKDWCYLGSNGAMLTNAWAKDSKGWCYLGADGYWVKSQWINDNGKWYYIDANGYMATGTVKIGPVTYKFASNGVWVS